MVGGALLDSAGAALKAARRLGVVGAFSSEGAGLVRQLAEQSTHGSGNRVVIGEWIKDGGGYIGEAGTNGGVFFETAEGVYEGLGKNRRTLAWAVNKQFWFSEELCGISHRRQ